MTVRIAVRGCAHRSLDRLDSRDHVVRVRRAYPAHRSVGRFTPSRNGNASVVRTSFVLYVVVVAAGILAAFVVAVSSA